MTARWRGVPGVCVLACLSLLSLLSVAHPAPEVAIPAADLHQADPLDGAIVFSLGKPSVPVFTGVLHLRERAVTQLPTQPLVFDPEGKWILGHGGQPICLLTEDGLHAYTPPPAAAGGAFIAPLDASHIYRGPDLAHTVIGCEQPCLDERTFDFWTFSIDPDAPDAERWVSSPAPFRGDWAFGASPTEVYVERDGRIFRGELGWEERQYRHVVRGFCPAVSPDGRLAYTDADRRTIWVRPPEGTTVIYPLREVPGHVVDIQWAPAGVANALLYECELVREGSDGSTVGSDSRYSILDLSTGRHITVFPGDYPGLRTAAFGSGRVLEAQWVAEPSVPIRNRIAAATDLAQPDSWPRRVRVCRTCRALAREFAAEFGFGGRSVAPTGSSAFVFQKPTGNAMEVGVQHSLHIVVNASAAPRPPASPTTWLPRQHLEARAERLARRMLQGAPWELIVRPASYRENPRTGRAELSCALFAPVGDVAFEMPATVSISLRAETGEPAPAAVRGLEDIPARLAQAPTRTAIDGAIKAAATEMGRAPESLTMGPLVRSERLDVQGTPQGATWDGVIVTRLNGTGLHGRGRQFARVRFPGGDAFTVDVKNAGYTDPVPGLDDVASEALPAVDMDALERGRAVECTTPLHPVWTADGSALLFASNRKPNGDADWQQGPGIMRLDLATRAIECVYPGYGRTEWCYLEVFGNTALTVLGADTLLLFDLATGEHRRCLSVPPGQDDRRRPMWGPALPVVSPHGTHFADVMRAGSGETGLYVGRMPRGDGKALEPVKVSEAYPWAEPTFSRDGSCLYFARTWPLDSEDRSGNSGNCAIFRYDFPDSDITKGTVTEISAGINGVALLHEMPDGRLLVQHCNQLSLLSPDTRELAPCLNMSLLAPGGPTERIYLSNPISVSSDGSRFAFCEALTAAQQSSGGIYVCGLDGTGLQRVTPPMPIQVKPYVFPKSGKSALDVWLAFEASRTKQTRGVEP